MTVSTAPAATVEANGCRIRYHDVGEGPPVLCLHGGDPGASGWSSAVVHIPSRQEMRDLYDTRCALLPVNVPRAVASITANELDEASRLAAELMTAEDGR